jgi:hypothetical protein
MGLTRMTHPEIEQREIFEGYLRGRLSPAEREAFEDHYFGCDQCFAQVKEAGIFAAGMRDAVASGSLEEKPRRIWWAYPGFGFAATAATVCLAAWLGWFELPRLRSELAAQREQTSRQMQRNSELTQQLAMARPTAGNLPLLILDATRAAEAPPWKLPQDARQLALWAEVGPSAQFAAYRLDVVDSKDQLRDSIAGLVKNSYGAVAAVIPSDRLSAQSYRVRLYGLGGDRARLVAEYGLTITR